MNKNQKIPKLFFCETCDYSTYNNGDFIKHTTTRKHKLMIESDCLAIVGNEKKSDISSNYNCSYCKFATHIKSNYDKHLLTEKHKKNINREPIETKYNCSQCSKEYLNYNALWKHKKHCVVISEQEPEP
jgi:DNA-directed RNA polymerase subunit RPC12/RpoP